MDNLQDLFNAATAAGQAHLLRFWDELSAGQKAELAAELGEIDFDELPKLIHDYVLNKPEINIPSDLQPAPYWPLVPRDAQMAQYYRRAEAFGEDLLRQGRVCALTVAGGQGTRLGFDGPKGTFPIGPVTSKTLFGYFADGLKRAGKKYGCKIDWYLMTSTLNRAATEKFFEDNDLFGLDRDQLFFFTQGVMPACGYDGKLLMSGKSALALSPNGHGGTLLALRRSGALDRMRTRGVEHISYFQVDNPLIPVVSPLFVGLHALEDSEMSAIMLAKTGPFEKLGNFCMTGGRLEVIEYSDLPDTLAESRNPDGSLRFIAGSPAIHVIARTFAERLTCDGKLQLPWHRADKKIPCIDAAGAAIKPEQPNGVKLESFIFDALPLARKTVILEGDRRNLFAPTKNRTGVDSVESCQAMLVDRDARRLESAGVSVPRKADGSVDALIEISPRAVLDDADAVEYVKSKNLTAIPRGAKLYLD